MSNRFNYDKAEADLYDSGCHHSEEIFSYRTEKGINSFMRENGLDPKRYYSQNKNSGGRSKTSDDGGCFITTACVKSVGLSDDCYELTTLRKFRDDYLRSRKDGVQDIANYYRTAPKIVESIDKRADAGQIWNGIYQDMICPAIRFIEANEYEKAYDLYKSFTLKLEAEYARA